MLYIYYPREVVTLSMCLYSLKVAYSGLISRKGFNQEIQKKHFQSQFVFVIAVTLFSMEWLVNLFIKFALAGN